MVKKTRDTATTTATSPLGSAYARGFHDAYYGRPASSSSSSSSACLNYARGYADGDRARPMTTVITTRIGPARIPNCTVVQAKRMMVDL